MRGRSRPGLTGVGVVLAALMALSGCDAGAGTPAPTRQPSATPVPIGARPPARVSQGPELVHPPAVLARPAQPVIDARYVAGLVGDHCLDRDLQTPTTSDPVLAVLDRSYALSADYAPADLVPASAAGLTGASGTKLVRQALVADLAAMRAAWQAAGLTVIVESAYRSYAAQAATFADWEARLGRAEALVRSARPGHSEHQLGTALDLTSPGWGGLFGDWAVESAEGAWLAAHAWEYGFVMSYPAGSQAETCFSYEPWHYRWVGREAAADHRASGLSLRTFLERRLDG